MVLLPSDVATPRLLLRRWRPDDAPALGEAVAASIDHLRPWMAWIMFEPLSDDDRRELIVDWDRAWARGGDAAYGVFRDGVVVGSCGLHRRHGPDTLDIGYWIHADHLRLGYAKEAAAALTTAALGMDGIERVEIHHDRANARSGAVPRSLGFDRGPEEADKVDAPGERGIDCTWYVTRSTWDDRRPA